MFSYGIEARPGTFYINEICRIVQAVRKHVAGDTACSRACKHIRIHKSPGLGIIVPALEVVQPGLTVITVASVQIRVQFDEFRSSFLNVLTITTITMAMSALISARTIIFLISCSALMS